MNRNPGTRNFLKKKQTTFFVTPGVGLTYWVFKPGSGLSVKSELFTHVLAYSKSTLEKRYDDKETENTSYDTKDKLNRITPSLNIGPEFSLRLGKRIALNVGISVNIRAYGYYKNSINTSYASMGAQMGFRAILGG